MDRLQTTGSNTRDDGLRRLRELTLTTALIGAAGAVGFGAVAAISNPGQTTALQAPGTGTSTQDPASAGHLPSSSDPFAARAPGLQAPQQLPVIGGDDGQVTSGSS